MKQPLVSIVCESYNHEPFLRKCLDGFVMQKTDFPIEILIHDDASTDKSADIIREYEARYPDLFKPIYQTENQYSKGVHIWATIQFPRASGKYIALCEGDDFWTDPLKLQKQVDYMESHPSCSLCCHNATLHWYDNRTADKPYTKLEERDYSAQEIIETWQTPATASFVFRSCLASGFADLMKTHPGVVIGDMPLLLYCSREGNIHALSDSMSVYGKHDKGWTQAFDAKKTFLHAYSWEIIRDAFRVPYYRLLSPLCTGLYLGTISRSLKEKDLKVFFASLYRGIIRHPVDGIKALARLPQERKKRNKL